MADICTIREAVKRAKEDQLCISEYALRQMIKSGKLPVRLVGRKALVYYPALIRHLQCLDGGDIMGDECVETQSIHGIRKIG